MGDWASADEIRIGIALDSWRPTLGTPPPGAVDETGRLAQIFLLDVTVRNGMDTPARSRGGATSMLSRRRLLSKPFNASSMALLRESEFLHRVRCSMRRTFYAPSLRSTRPLKARKVSFVVLK